MKDWTDGNNNIIYAYTEYERYCYYFIVSFINNRDTEILLSEFDNLNIILYHYGISFICMKYTTWDMRQ